MDVKVILKNRKDEFEKEIKEYLTKGYKINSSNVSFINKLKFNNKIKNVTSNMSEILYEDRPYEICFYAILIKE